ncbi:MAG: endonuclease/exonuclease/phosphatase family protein [Phycisphaeraceae bacterium]|nr:MAG: endonuclease/exonuclease/phosphatase family protein [Phycisphaeraceae bacterium]
MHRLLVALLAVAAAMVSALPARAGDDLRVASFNIRYGTADDGPDAWPLRRDKVVETIADLDADLVGLQEALPFQIGFLLEHLPRYGATGVSREDGKTDGEASPILYDRTRFTLAASGTFWLSDTPDEAGSNTWGAACTRICTWARLVDLKTGRAVYHFNTHFDHVNQPAREKSAALILQRIASRAANEPVVLTGDLNAGENNAAVHALLTGEVGLTDTYRAIHPSGMSGTFTGFKLDSEGGDRKIDYVLIGPGLRATGAGIETRKIDGRYPSDHFPVWAALGFE